jgi:phosphoglycolate phosphatase
LPTLRCQDRVFEQIQAIIFDKDGTLAAVESYLKQLGQKRARLVDAQVPGTEAPLLLAFGIELQGINPMGLQAIGSRRDNVVAAAAYIAETGKTWPEALQMATATFLEADTYLQPKAAYTPLFSGIQDLLHRVAQANIQIGVLSADTPPHVQSFLETYGLTSYIHSYQGADDTLSKPDPRLYTTLCEHMGVPPIATLMVGDSTLDMAMAQAAGSAGGIGVAWGWTVRPVIAQANCVIDAPSQLEILSGD